MANVIRGKLEKLLTTDQFSYPELRSMFLTLALDQFFIFFIGMLSTALVSSVGEAAVAAVSMVGTVNGMVSLLPRGGETRRKSAGSSERLPGSA